MITFDPTIDSEALINAPPEEKLALVNAYNVHCDPTNTQEIRDAGGRMFYRCLLPYLSTISPN
jgi:hypothetical protein